VKGIERYVEEKRDRWLNEEELRNVWRVLDDIRHTSQHVFTGQAHKHFVGIEKS